MAGDAQRPDAEARVKALEKKFSTGAGTEPVKTEPVKTEPTKTEPEQHKEPTKIDQAGRDLLGGRLPAPDRRFRTAGEAARRHRVRARGLGLHRHAVLPDRGRGQVHQSKAMKWRYKELVGRIPPTKMLGESVQYYIEVKDATGAVVTRSGKSTSPNLVTLEAGASPRFYPDWNDEGQVATAAETRESDTDEDPLNKKKVVARDR